MKKQLFSLLALASLGFVGVQSTVDIAPRGVVAKSGNNRTVKGTTPLTPVKAAPAPVVNAKDRIKGGIMPVSYGRGVSPKEWGQYLYASNNRNRYKVNKNPKKNNV